MDDGNAGTRLPTWRDIEAAIASGDFKILRDMAISATRSVNESELDAEDVDEIDPKARVRAYYVRIWDANQVGLGRTALTRLIEDASQADEAKEFEWKPSDSSLRRWIIDRGELGDRRNADMISDTGRTPKTYCFANQVNRALLKCVIWYWSLDGRNFNDTWARLTRMLRTLNSIRKKRGAKTFKRPHCETLRRYIRARECYETWITRYGKHAADLRWRPTGKSLEASHILQLTILDSTVLDSWCVLDAENRLPMGRPHLVIIIDVFSRCVLAWLVVYEPPQVWTVGEAVKRANRPKPWLAQRFPKAPTGAEIYGKPNELILDDAWENTGRSTKDALLDLGISVTYAPIRTPTYKAIGERIFRTLNTLLVHKLAGAVRLDIETRRLLGLDPEKDAILTAEEVEALIEEAINHYHHEVHETLNAPPALVWKKAAKAGVNVLRDDSLLAKTLGIVEHGTLDPRGIVLSGLWYSDKAVIQRILDNNVSKTPVRGRRKKTASVRVKFKYNPGDLGTIFVFDPTDRTYHEMKAKNFRYANGRSMYQHEIVKALAKQENLNFISEEDQLAALQMLRTRIEHAAPHLRTKGRKAAARFLQDPASRSIIEGDTVAVSVEGRDAAGQLLVENESMVGRRTDKGAAVASASRRSAHDKKKREAPPSAALPHQKAMIASFQRGKADPDDPEFLANQGW
ncbi:MAG: hypothetical protein ACRCY3_11480 [Sphingorhabdus sp.]